MSLLFGEIRSAVHGARDETSAIVLPHGWQDDLRARRYVFDHVRDVPWHLTAEGKEWSRHEITLTAGGLVLRHMAQAECARAQQYAIAHIIQRAVNAYLPASTRDPRTVAAITARRSWAAGRISEKTWITYRSAASAAAQERPADMGHAGKALEAACAFSPWGAAWAAACAAETVMSWGDAWAHDLTIGTQLIHDHIRAYLEDGGPLGWLPAP